MKRYIYATAVTLLLIAPTACSDDAPNEGEGITKEVARQRAENGDQRDYCEEEGWYGDGECDPFCIEPDPDCEDEPGDCPTIFAPVCGTDGETYPNTCIAEQAGAEIAHEGECDDEPGQCLGNDGCGEDQYCNFPESDACGLLLEIPGTCETRTEDCALIFAPVCGCDGETYGNACQAAAEGVNVAAEGECGNEPDPNHCGGIQGLACDDDEYCAYAPGDQCGAADQLGQCQIRPEGCDLDYNPVCGCDDETYSNSCMAASAGISILHEGECEGGPDPGQCLGNDGCGEGDYCLFPESDACGLFLETPGTCEERPEACIEIFDPVCGCDGETYSNSCHAAAEGVNVAAEGECEGEPDPNHCGGIQGLACDDGEYCDYAPEAQCGAADQLGQCLPRPEACAQILDPVCGCDGQTHSNACMAANAGVSVLHEGECE